MEGLTDLEESNLENLKRRLRGITPKLYKVRAWVRSDDAMKLDLYSFEEVALTETYARYCFEEALSYIDHMRYNPRFTEGYVELFVPSVFDNGKLASWPELGEYIMKKTITHGRGRYESD